MGIREVRTIACSSEVHQGGIQSGPAMIFLALRQGLKPLIHNFEGEGAETLACYMSDISLGRVEVTANTELLHSSGAS